jgi:phage gp46-like protein
MILIQWDTATSHGSWVLTPTGLASGDPLQAAVLVSLFSDRRAAPDDRLPADDDPRGWWADSYDSQPIGTRLWLLLRAKRTTETARRARDMIQEGLAWLIADRVAASVEVTTEWIRRSALGARIVILQRDGTRRELNFGWAWTEAT